MTRRRYPTRYGCIILLLSRWRGRVSGWLYRLHGYSNHFGMRGTTSGRGKKKCSRPRRGRPKRTMRLARSCWPCRAKPQNDGHPHGLISMSLAGLDEIATDFSAKASCNAYVQQQQNYYILLLHGRFSADWQRQDYGTYIHRQMFCGAIPSRRDSCLPGEQMSPPNSRAPFPPCPQSGT